jgi:hypothetical protein
MREILREVAFENTEEQASSSGETQGFNFGSKLSEEGQEEADHGGQHNNEPTHSDVSIQKDDHGSECQRSADKAEQKEMKGLICFPHQHLWRHKVITTSQDSPKYFGWS